MANGSRVWHVPCVIEKRERKREREREREQNNPVAVAVEAAKTKTGLPGLGVRRAASC
jgi:hypothetical protein